MKRFKVLYIKDGIQHCKYFNERRDALEFAIVMTLENFDTRVIDNQTGKEIWNEELQDNDKELGWNKRDFT